MTNRSKTATLVLVLLMGTAALAGCAWMNTLTPSPPKYTPPPGAVTELAKTQPAAAATSFPTPKNPAPPAGPQGTEVYLPAISQNEPTITPTETITPTYAPTPDMSSPPKELLKLPVLPNGVSERAKQIYADGLAKGNDPKHFAKVGDCQVIHQYFLGIYDHPGYYQLGPYEKELSPVIDYFQGSYDRLSKTVRTGYNVASVLSPINADPKECNAGETPLQCEWRLWHPSIAIISMETWTKDRPTALYEQYMRQILDFVISQGTLPILATKADNLEGDYSINLIVVKLAQEYDIPLWNFFGATYPLPLHGLTEDGFHLTHAPNIYASEEDMQMAWPWRNLTGLQAIDRVWRAVR